MEDWMQFFRLVLSVKLLHCRSFNMNWGRLLKLLLETLMAKVTFTSPVTLPQTPTTTTSPSTGSQSSNPTPTPVVTPTLPPKPLPSLSHLLHPGECMDLPTKDQSTIFTVKGFRPYTNVKDHIPLIAIFKKNGIETNFHIDMITDGDTRFTTQNFGGACGGSKCEQQDKNIVAWNPATAYTFKISWTNIYKVRMEVFDGETPVQQWEGTLWADPGELESIRFGSPIEAYGMPDVLEVTLL